MGKHPLGQGGLLIVRAINFLVFVHFIPTSPAICGLTAALLFPNIYLLPAPNLTAVFFTWAVFVYRLFVEWGRIFNREREINMIIGIQRPFAASFLDTN